MRVVHGFPDSRVVSGVNQSVWELARAQAAGHADDVTVLTFDPAAGGVAPDGVDVVVIRLWGVPFALARLRPDVFHLHSVLSPSLALATLAARVLRIPVVASPRGGYNPQAVARRGTLKHWYTRSVEAMRVRWTQLQLALTDKEAAHIRALFGARVVRVVGNGVTPLALQEAQLDEHGGQCNLVYLGRSATYKGIDRLLNLAGEMHDAALRIYGDGFESLAQTDIAPANVRFMGVVSGSKKAEAVAKASCYVHLSRFEAYGRSIVEAMGMGVPVCVSTDCDLADLIRELTLGLVLEDPDDAVISARILTRYLASPEAMLRAGRAREWALTEAIPSAVANRIREAYGLVGVSTAHSAPYERRFPE
jgi:glycosyltransferase involved in cell wall biosynthesis